MIRGEQAGEKAELMSTCKVRAFGYNSGTKTGMDSII